jgi:hypothetical protein
VNEQKKGRQRIAQPRNLMADTMGKMPIHCRGCPFENNCIRYRWPRGQATCVLVPWVSWRFTRAGASATASD